MIEFAIYKTKLPFGSEEAILVQAGFNGALDALKALTDMFGTNEAQLGEYVQGDYLYYIGAAKAN